QGLAPDAQRPIRPGDALVLTYAVRASPGAPVPLVAVSATGTIKIAGFRNFEPFQVTGMTPKTVADQVNDEFRRQGEQRTVEVRYPTAAELAQAGRGGAGGAGARPQVAMPPPAPVAPGGPAVPGQLREPMMPAGGAGVTGGPPEVRAVEDHGSDLVDVVIVLRRAEVAADKAAAEAGPATKPTQP
ncbi:MAG TPA: hypothetical protein VF796_24835, partial [Humisphaera sp.]